MIEVRTQGQLEAALQKNNGELIVCAGDGWFVAWDSSHVEAWGSSHVVAWGSSHVVAWDSSHVVARDSSHVVAWGSSHVVAWGSSHVVARDSSHVVAWGSSHVVAWDSSHVVASPYVTVSRQSPRAMVAGGVIIEVPRINSPQVWLDYHGLKAVRGVVTLYKAVDDEWHAGHRYPDGTWPDYSPGSKPEAPDFEPAMRDCGRGLHACPSPSGALWFKTDATKFVAIPVRVSDLGCPDPDGDTSKIRFRCACRPIYEVDRYGGRVT